MQKRAPQRCGKSFALTTRSRLTVNPRNLFPIFPILLSPLSFRNFDPNFYNIHNQLHQLTNEYEYSENLSYVSGELSTKSFRITML